MRRTRRGARASPCGAAGLRPPAQRTRARTWAGSRASSRCRIGVVDERRSRAKSGGGQYSRCRGVVLVGRTQITMMLGALLTKDEGGCTSVLSRWRSLWPRKGTSARSGHIEAGRTGKEAIQDELSRISIPEGTYLASMTDIAHSEYACRR
ncbi:hypothetical protein B0H13DRAFT_2038574 [Mycena leptocephala]|nr:hypothetical protein B0H13DRAFT_2038574 [Mycena leptocephala]